MTVPKAIKDPTNLDFADTYTEQIVIELELSNLLIDITAVSAINTKVLSSLTLSNFIKVDPETEVSQMQFEHFILHCPICHILENFDENMVPAQRCWN
jgi:hypothetical protein